MAHPEKVDKDRIDERWRAKREEVDLKPRSLVRFLQVVLLLMV